MWLIALIVALILWLILDNILIAGILAVFGVYLFSVVRALWMVKKNPDVVILEKVIHAEPPVVKQELVVEDRVNEGGYQEEGEDTSFVELAEK